MSKMAVWTNALHGIKRVLQCSHMGSRVKYRGGARRYTVCTNNLNRQLGTPKQNRGTLSEMYNTFVLRVPEYSTVIWS